MTSITELHNLLSTSGFWDDRKILTIMGMPGSGISTVLRELSRESSQSKESQIKYIYINLFDVGQVTEINTLKHIAFTLQKELGLKNLNLTENDYYKLKFSLIEALRTVGEKKQIVMVLDNFENVFDLSSYFFEFIRETAFIEYGNEKKTFKFVVSSDHYIDDEELLENLGKFYPYIYENVVFISGFETKNIAEVLEAISKNKTQTADQIYQISGGNPKLVDRLLDMYAEKIKVEKSYDMTQHIEQILLDEKEIYYYIYRIWNGLTTKQKTVILGIKKDELFELNPNLLSNLYLIETGIIRKLAENKYGLGIGLLIERVEDFEKSKDLKDKSNIIIPKEEVEEDFTPEKGKSGGVQRLLKKEDPDADIKGVDLDVLSKQEYDVFQNFREKRFRLLTKDDIAKVMWNRKRRSRKDDWAIDQLMKRLREKLGENVGSKLYTVRGRGYRYSPV